MFARKATMGRLLISLLLRHDDHYFSSGGHLQSFQKSMNRSGAIWWLDYPCLGEAGCQPRGARWDNDGGGNESAPAPESARRLLRAPPQPLQLGEVRRHADLVTDQPVGRRRFIVELILL